MAQYPMFPLWTDAYLGDTNHLTTIEHGAYLLLLMAMWRTAEKRLPYDDVLLARYARLTAAQWSRIKPVLMPFFRIKGGFITQSRLTDEAEAVKRNSKRQSEKAKARWLKEKETADAAAMPEACLPSPTHIHNQEKKESSNEDSKESCASGASDDGVAVADLVPADGRSLTRKERYPTKAKLPRDGRSIRWPVEFEAAWQAYPVRPEDTREACYAHWRRHVVENRVDPATITENAEAWGMLLNGYEYRIGFLRFCREALWNQAPPKRREEPKTNGQLVAEAIARQRRGDPWDPFGEIENEQRQSGTLHAVHRDDEDFGPEGAAGSGGRTPGPGGASGQNVVPLLAAGGVRRL